MARQLDLERLSAIVKTKRRNRGLREVAKEIGDISPSTLSRIENGKMPDMDTFLRLCDWLEISPMELIQNTEDVVFNEPDIETPDLVEIQLRADKNLDEETAVALAQMVRAAYRAVLNQK